MSEKLKVLGRWRKRDPLAISPADQRSLDHVAEVSKNARTTWFALIGLLLFCGVTLLGVEDRDFFEYGVSTDLPLIGVSVPTKSFFWAAPLLVTGLYTYLHLYLDKLWKALGLLEDTVGGRPVTEAVYPWLISDTALGMRGPRVERGGYWWITRIVTFCLCWLIGPAIMWLFWTKSWAPHDERLTTLIGVQLVWVSVIGVVSWRGMCRETLNREPALRQLKTPGVVYFGAVAALLVGGYGWGKTESGGFGGLYSAYLYRANFTQPETDWKGRDRALREYQRDNRSDVIAELKRESGKPYEEAISKRLLKEFNENRAGDLDNLERENQRELDLRAAYLVRVNLIAHDLRWVKMQGAHLGGARLEGANLWEARLDKANLWAASLEGASLRWARLEGANLRWARLDGAQLNGARLDGADLTNAFMSGSFGKYTSAIGTVFDGARNLTQDQLDSMFGDGTTPELVLIQRREAGEWIDDYLHRPLHWPSLPIPKDQWAACWKEWAISEGAVERLLPNTDVKCTTHASGQGDHHPPLP